MAIGEADLLGNASLGHIEELVDSFNLLGARRPTASNTHIPLANDSTFGLPAPNAIANDLQPPMGYTAATNPTTDSWAGEYQRHNTGYTTQQAPDWLLTNMALNPNSQPASPAFPDASLQTTLPAPIPGLHAALLASHSVPGLRTPSTQRTSSPALRAASPALHAMSPALRAMSPAPRAMSPARSHPSSPSPASTRGEVPILSRTGPGYERRSVSQTRVLVDATRINAAYNSPYNSPNDATPYAGVETEIQAARVPTPTPNANPPPINHRRRIPLVQDVERNVLLHFQLTSRTRQVRRLPSDNPLLPNGLPRAGALSEDERKFMQLIEFHLLFEMLTFEAWLSDPRGALEKAMQYGEKMMGKSRDTIVVVENFDLLALGKCSSLRSDCLKTVFSTVSRMLDVVMGDEAKATSLMGDNLILYPNQQINPSKQYLCDLIPEVLVGIFFDSSKEIGLPFIIEICTPADRVECGSWHKQLHDRTATRGLSVAAIAFAATTIYYTLDKMARNLKKLHFNDQGYKLGCGN
ncbi:hypothetical protein FRC09_001930 [Ceratobasidium sp. 395]|nr:hypothetical protein FRC09_001930 [Ceratobasidium sp. 395]